MKAIVGTSDADAITVEAIDQTAADYEISREAVEAALHYYSKHGCAIDALLEVNEAALA